MKSDRCVVSGRELMHNEKLKKKIGSNMTKGMLMPYKKVTEAIDSE